MGIVPGASSPISASFKDRVSHGELDRCADLAGSERMASMRTIKLGRTAAFALVLLFAAACTPATKRAAGHGVHGGTLRVLSAAPMIYSLDTAVAYTPDSSALERAYARRLYGFDNSGPPEGPGALVPDLATGLPQVSPDRRTYTFTIRSGVHYAPPVNREVVAEDFVTAVQRLYDKKTPSPGQLYADLIAGVAAFRDGRVRTITGIVAVDPHTLRITLAKPAGDFLSMLTMPFFAPVPGEYARRYRVGDNYSGHLVGSGPYTIEQYQPLRYVVLARNRNWDPATDPLRQAWVDRIEVQIGSANADAVQQAIEQDNADLALDFDPPPARLRAIASDPAKARRIRVVYSGCERYLALETNRAAGPTSDVRVRRAINLAVDKVDALEEFSGGPGGYRGAAASTVLPPNVLGYHPYDRYRTPGNRGDPERARKLLAQAGYPDGVTLTFASHSEGKTVLLDRAIGRSLARANIRLAYRTYAPAKVDGALRVRSQRREHQIMDMAWCMDWPGDSARSFFVPLLDGRHPPDSRNFGEYDNPDVNRLIDRALAEHDPEVRAALWSQLDERVMRDAAWVPLFYHKASYFFSARVRNWTLDRSSSMPDLTAIWLDPRAR
jgi:peptide/nickel transport system substrate-binding protein